MFVTVANTTNKSPFLGGVHQRRFDYKLSRQHTQNNILKQVKPIFASDYNFMTLLINVYSDSLQGMYLSVKYKHFLRYKYCL